MEQGFISLLYPTEAAQSRAAEKGGVPNISEAVCEELGLSSLIDLRNSSLSKYFTDDPAVIRYRQAAVSDMLQSKEIGETLNRVLPILFDITELRRLDTERVSTGDSYLYSITEIELYISCIEALRDGFSPIRDKVESEAFLHLFRVIFELAESDYYKDLNEKLSSLASRIREVKSITVGVNLDEMLRPSGAGVISINSEPFKSGKVLDKILRMSFRNDAMTCIASLVPFGKNEAQNRKEALTSAFNGAIEEVFRSSVRAWRDIAGDYVLASTDFLLKLLPEIEFMTRATELVNRLTENGNTLTVPRLDGIKNKTFMTKGLYNPAVALKIAEPVVENDFSFDDDGRIFIITGPNRGGKSVITCAVGIAQGMMQLGLPVPAAEAVLSPVDAIFTHFPEGADDTIDKGRLGEECARLSEIFDAVTENSMILLDESLSSTGAYEASYIAREILAGFGAVGCRGIFSTHLHELAASTEDINRSSLEKGGVRIDNLVAGMEEGRRSFHIERKKPDGKSYARDIAEKYGLSFDNIIKKRCKN